MRGGAAARRPLVLDGTRGSVAAAEGASLPSAKPAVAHFRLRLFFTRSKSVMKLPFAAK
jgi:hypothetical protein